MDHRLLYLVCIFIVALAAAAGAAPGGETGAVAPVQVTTNQSDQISAAIDGERIVWVDGRHGGADIYLYDIAGGTETRVTDGNAIALWPEISGNRIVWEDSRSGTPEIWLYDTTTRTETPITNGTGGNVPAIDGDTVVWLDGRAGDDGGIYAMNLTTQETTRISSGPVQGDPLIISPDLSGDTVIWADQSSGNYTVFVSQGGGAPVSLASSSAMQGFPAISGDRAVWSEVGNGSSSLVIHNLTSGEEQRIAGGPPGLVTYLDISGDLVVWQNATSQDTDDIYLYEITTGEIQQITSDNAAQYLPQISGDRIVWMDNRSGNWDIYLYTPGA